MANPERHKSFAIRGSESQFIKTDCHSAGGQCRIQPIHGCTLCSLWALFSRAHGDGIRWDFVCGIRLDEPHAGQSALAGWSRWSIVDTRWWNVHLWSRWKVGDVLFDVASRDVWVNPKDR